MNGKPALTTSARRPWQPQLLPADFSVRKAPMSSERKLWQAFSCGLRGACATIMA